MSPTGLHLVQISLWLACLCTLELKADTLSSHNVCIKKTKCNECIQTPSCAWCFEPSATYGDHPRCFQPAGQQQLHKACPDMYKYFPKTAFKATLEKALSKGLAAGSGVGFGGGAASLMGSASAMGAASSSSSSSFSGSFSQSSSEIIQVSPQRFQMSLRARESQSIHVFYAQAQDYPLDLYYLMDLSKSMEDDKDKLSTLGDRLAETMRNVTSEFQIGFGSFVDKVVMPYVSTVPSNLEQPCANCSAPYGYRHAMRLSRDSDMFSRMVKEAQVSGNLDAPEGGFDAIMQAVVCKDQIGWRDTARRVLVFSTDDGFHYAGDGKLGGIIRPNDGLCHLDRGYYSYSSLQDYPSVSQLNMKVKQNAINVIFAVTKERYQVYEQLAGHIEAARSRVLSADSSNIVELIRDHYKNITSTVEMKDNATDGVEIRYYSRCLKPDGAPENNTNRCENFKVGQLIDFRLEVFLKSCPKDPRKWNQTIQVYPVGLSESVFIDLEMLCSCPCEHPGHKAYKENAEECSFSGTLKCGICECNPGHEGQRCECKQDGPVDDDKKLGCRPPGSGATVDCSGKGVCICGQCVCEIRDNPNEIISGQWCQCDNYSCYRHGGVICGGHGICDCGVCKCDYPYIGKACDCSNVTTSCYPPFKETPQLCDGHGDCICGKCECHNTTEGKYTGRYCERCPNCTETCDELKPCVLCQMYHIGPYEDDDTCVKKCGNFTPVEVEVVQADEQNDEFPCAGYDEEDCRYVFVYKKVNETHYIVKAQKERECPPKVFLLGIVLGVIAAVVLMGLAILLLWKLLTTIHDRREFAKFEKERMMAKWDTGENPIYKQATSTFKNPTYAGKG